MKPGAFQISLKVFLQRGDAFLVLRDRLSQTGDLPGGRIGHAEFYDDWAQCVRRELREELGGGVDYALRNEPVFVFPHFIQSAGRDALGVAYRAHFRRGEIRLSEEHDDLAWVPIASYDPVGYFSEHMAAAVRRFQRLAG